MAKTKKQPTFHDVLSILGNEKFDVSPATQGAGAAGAGHNSAGRDLTGNRVSKYGCAAEIAPSTEPDAPVRITARPGWVLGGEIARLVDRGYQKFLKTSRLEIPATADILRAIHDFADELTEACGGLVLYNEALGTTSDKYLYDRVQGRE